MRKYDKKEKELEAKELAAKEASEVPTPELPVNYTSNDEDRDQKEFADADVDQSGKAIADELQQPVQDDTKVPVQTSKEDEIASDKDTEMPKDDISKEADELHKDDTSEPPPEEPPMPPDDAPPKEVPEAPKQGTSQYYSDLMRRFKEAQKQSGINQDLNDMQKYAYSAGTSFQGTKKDPQLVKLLDEEGNRSNLPIQQLEQQLQIDAQDPNSKAAIAYRKLLAENLGIDESKLANLNFNQQKEVGTQFLGDRNKKLLSQVAMMNATSKASMVQNTSRALDQKQPLIDSTIDKNNAQADYLNLKPSFEQQKLDKADSSQDDKADDKDIKRIDSFNKNITGALSSSRTGLGKAFQQTQVIDNVQQLLNGTGDLNSLDPRQVAEVYRVLDRVLSGGSPTIHGSESLTPETARIGLTRLVEKFSNQAKGANAASFLKRAQDTFVREKAQAQKQMKDAAKDYGGGFTDLADHPNMINSLKSHGLNPDDFFNYEKSKNNDQPQSQLNFDPSQSTDGKKDLTSDQADARRAFLLKKQAGGQ